MKLRPHFFKSLKSPKQSTQKSIAPKDLATPPKKKLKRKLLAIFFIITLVILPSVPSEAAVLDPIIKVILPLYERITGKNKNTDPTAANPATDSRTQEPHTPPEPELPTPDLLSLLQAEFAIDRDDPTTALELYKTQALKDNATAVFERALGLSMQLETPTNHWILPKLGRTKMLTMSLSGFMSRIWHSKPKIIPPPPKILN